ncbi:DUF5686 family protein [Salegentibacter sp. F188]|uniref:DUF5686 family protein n=1 Tax=Autumnicola patrickiae TaxID=3075591 RepID=A0ABU3E6M9_9FLAO|nr:DUF5686 family protein [Salegentibacter sp. F188]MDT0691656.1 DUF5686 family protein [Salegentibacter sp. F188]
MQKFLLFLLFSFSFASIMAQNEISGRIISAENGEPLPYATINYGEEGQMMTNIDGSFEITYEEDQIQLKISYVGFYNKNVDISGEMEYVVVKLQPSITSLDAVMISSEENPANAIIKKAIAAKEKNDPERALEAFQHKTYTKFLIDNQSDAVNLDTDTTNIEIETIINTARAYLSEKISKTDFQSKKGRTETVLGLKTAGFKEPVYEMLSLEANPYSLYKKDYQLFQTDYAGPLADKALRNYTYKIIDTTTEDRPAYVIYFAPKREKKVAGLEGILYLDTASYAIQRAKAQLLGAIKLEVNHYYHYYEEADIWFPERQTTEIEPGTGTKDISVFGGGISVGTLQRSDNIINRVLGSGKVSPDAILSSTSSNYDVVFDSPEDLKQHPASIEVPNGVNEQPETFWKANRQEPYTYRDENAAQYVDSIIKADNIERRIEVKQALGNGNYPLGFWNFDIGNFYRSNGHEGWRLGVGGRTNDRFSEHFNLHGYGAYGLRDKEFKYNIGTQIYLNKSSGTNLNIDYTDDILEFGEFQYRKRVDLFSLFRPRFGNIASYFNHRTLSTGLEHRFNAYTTSELQLSNSRISMNGSFDYTYLHNGQLYSEYDVTEITFSILWRPFSRFLHTPEENVMLERGFPRFTAQISQAVEGIAGGDFSFTRAGFMVEHEISQLDQSRTEFIFEANYAFGDLPLTHVFHASPNNVNEPRILNRFSVAGRTAFETMYFNEFFSDKQAMFHIRHQLRPFYITRGFKPALVLFSRYAIGDFKEKDKHPYAEFNTLKHGYSEAGVELNNLLFGFGLSAAYRFGAYHLPEFRENFSFKFTFQLPL